MTAAVARGRPESALDVLAVVVHLLRGELKVRVRVGVRVGVRVRVRVRVMVRVRIGAHVVVRGLEWASPRRRVRVRVKGKSLTSSTWASCRSCSLGLLSCCHEPTWSGFRVRVRVRVRVLG